MTDSEQLLAAGLALGWVIGVVSGVAFLVWLTKNAGGPHNW
jgi:hypothetical protein